MVWPAVFVAALATFLGVKRITLCYFGEDTSPEEEGVQLLKENFFLKFVPAEDLPCALEDTAGESNLILCPLESILKIKSENYFQSQNHWLTTFSREEEIGALPLRLDSNFISYHIIKNGKVTLTEWYKVKAGRAMSVPLAIWSPDSGLVAPTPFRWHRRTDFGGAVLRNGLVLGDFPPVCMVQQKGNGGMVTTGLLPDFLDMLVDKLNFTVKHISPEDDEYGRITANGSWTGVIGLLRDRSIDLSISGLTVTRDRSTVAGFTLGVFSDGITVISQDPDVFGHRDSLNFWAYLTVFPPSVWVLILAIAMLTGLCCETLNRFSNIEEEGFMRGLVLAFVDSLQLSLEGASPEQVRGLPQRTTHLSVALCFLLLFVSYNGDLTSFLTASPAPFKLGTFEVSARTLLLLLHTD